MKIEKNIPITEDTRGRKAKYPFKDMEVGDSVFVAGQGSNGNAYSAATAAGHRNGTKFTARQCKNGVRIWRVA